MQKKIALLLSILLVFSMTDFSLLKPTSTYASGPIIVIDPGHGGADPGAVAGGFTEKELNMQLSRKVVKELESFSSNVYLTRNRDVTMSLQNRVDFAHSKNADLFVSIHHDANQSSSVNGISVFYSSYRPGIDTTDAYVRINGRNFPFVAEDTRNRRYIYNDNGVNRAISIDIGRVYDPTPTTAAMQSRQLAHMFADGLAGMGYRRAYSSSGVTDGNFYVTRWTNMPSVLVENGFMTNPTELRKISDPRVQDRQAKVIADTIKEYFRTIDQQSNGMVNINGTLNVRSGPGTHHTRIDRLANNHRVQVVGRVRDWYKITYNGKEGFVSSRFVNVRGSVPNLGEVYYATVTSSGSLNVRMGPSTRHDVISRLQSGSTIQVFGQTNGWYKVRVNGRDGYVSGSLVNVDSGVPQLDKQFGIVTSRYSLNIRSGPGTNHSRMGSIPSGHTVIVQGNVRGWYKVTYNGTEGFVSGRYLETFGNTFDLGNLYFGTVTASPRLNVRMGPNGHYSLVSRVSNGETVELIGQTNGWYLINYNGMQGFVTGRFINADSGVPEIDDLYGRVTIETSLNMRSGPGTRHTRLRSIPSGHSVIVFGEVRGWYKVNYNGTEGFVSGRYLEVQGNAPNLGDLYFGTVTASNVLNVRMGPSTRYDVMGRLSNGETVEVLGRLNGWYLINQNGMQGFVSGSLISVDAGVPEIEGAYGTVIDVNRLNFRTGPSTNYDIIESIPRNTVVIITEESNGWYEITYNGNSGFVSGRYIDVFNGAEIISNSNPASLESEQSIDTDVLQLENDQNKDEDISTITDSSIEENTINEESSTEEDETVDSSPSLDAIPEEVEEQLPLEE